MKRAEHQAKARVLPRLAVVLAAVLAAVVVLPSCKVLGIPFRVVGAVVNTGTAAVESGVRKHKLRKEQKEREEKAAKEAAAKPGAGAGAGAAPAAGVGVSPQAPGVLPPLDELPPATAPAPVEKP